MPDGTYGIPETQASSPGAPVSQQGHACPACGTLTLPLTEAIRAAHEGRLTTRIPGAMPNAEQMARWLKPPDLPDEATVARQDIWGNHFFTAVAIVVIFLTGLMLYAILGPWSVLLSVAATYVLLRRARLPKIRSTKAVNKHERFLTEKAWDRRMQVWERLGVCPSCGMLSDPVSGRIAEWHSIPSLFVGD